ncbi:MAG: site-specific integrase [Rhodothermales bacterium]|nr:site-specific integrase [Rhodothermales bacterium]
MATISIVRYPGMKNHEGTVPLYLRASAGNKVRYASLNVRIPEADWNSRTEQVRKTNPHHANLNRYLLDVKSEAQAVLAELLAKGQQVTAARLRDGLRSKIDPEEEQNAGDFLAYAMELCNEYERRGQISTFESYRTSVLQLRDFMKARYGRAELPFEEITVTLLRGFETYLHETVKSAINTVHKRMRSIRTLLYTSIRDGRFPQEQNPFFQLKLKSAKVEKGRLSIEEIEAIERLELPAHSPIWHTRNSFLFAFYAGGMRFSDVVLLQWRHVQGDRLSYKMKKTNEATSIALVPPALKILEFYADRRTSPYGSVFPMIDGYDTSTQRDLHNAISSRNSLANKYLKQIQQKLGIQTRLSFHLARHSLADYLRRKGWSIYDISKVLAHANVRVTEQYLRGFDSEDLDEKMRSVF